MRENRFSKTKDKISEGIRYGKKDRNAIPAWEAVLRKLTEFLYPPRCPFCDEILTGAERKEFCCSICRKKIPWVTGPVCMKCGKPVGSEEAEFCPDCDRIAHEFVQGAAVFTFSGCMPDSIYRFKSANRRDYLDFYADAMFRCCSRYLKRWQPQLILPVPMHPGKRAARGYNQAELLAERISRMTGIPYSGELLRCVKKTKIQKTLGEKARRNNLRGSFALTGDISGLHRVLVIDDVYTTGSTMDEVARTLRQAGVEHTFFFVLCIGKGKKPVGIAEKICYTET